MKKFFSFLFALVLAAGAVTGVTLLASAANGGDDVVMLLDANVTVTSWDELKAAISSASNGDVIALENDIEVAAGEKNEEMSMVRADITIDLCGHTINVTGKGYDSGAPDLFVVDEGYTFTLTSSAVDGNEQPINGGIKTNDGTSMHIVSTTGVKSNDLTWNISNIDIEGFGALNEGTSDPYGLIYYYGTPTKTNINIENVNFKNNRALCIAINGSTTNEGGTTIKSSSFENNVIDGYRWGMVAYIDCPGNVEITGLTVKNNGDSSVTSTTKYSSGMSTVYINKANNVMVSGCDFENNISYAGGAFRVDKSQGSTAITDNIVKNNQSGDHSGGFYVTNCQNKVEVSNNNISENSATTYAGGFSLNGSGNDVTFDISNNTVSNNNATTYAGGFYVTDGEGELSISENTFTKNKAGSYAGAFRVNNQSGEIEVLGNEFSENEATTYAGAFRISDSSSDITISKNEVSGNTATTYAGGFYLGYDTGEIDISENKILNNNAGTNVGGFYLANNTGNTNILKNEISENTASEYAGGFCESSTAGTVTVLGNEISNNTAGSYAGGMRFNTTGGAVTVDGNTITENTATYGGGMYFNNVAHNIDIKNNTVTKNTATSTSKGGGGMYMTSVTGDVSLQKNTFSENTSAYCGGAIFADTITGDVTVQENTITKNSGPYAGGVEISSLTGDLDIRNNTITGNTATSTYGGAFYVTGSKGNLSIAKNTFTQNKAGSYAGAFRVNAQNGDIDVSENEFTKNEATTYAGAFRISDNTSNVTVEKNKVTENKAGSYAGGFFLGYNTGEINVSENDVSKNTAETYAGGFYVANTTGEVAVSENEITDNTAGTYAAGFEVANITDKVEIEENKISKNTAKTDMAGGFYLSAGSSVAGDVSVVISKNEISQNMASADLAGGFYLNGSGRNIQATISENTISNNTASYAGGMSVYNTTGEVELKDNTVMGNAANTYAGGIFISSITNGVTATGNEITGNTAGTYGGGIVLASGSTFTMESGAIYGNTANSYAADVYNKEGSEFTLIEAADMDVTDYTVKGWYNDAGNARYAETENPAEYTVKSGDTSEQSLVAAYGCTLSYDAGLGKGTIDSAFMDITKGEESVAVSSADGMTEPNGYCRFVNWNLAPDGSDETSYSPDDEITLTKNTTLYAQWDKHNFSTEKAEDETDEDGYKYIEFNWCDDDNDLEHLNQITCSATFTCTDCDYTETRDCSVTWEHDKDATCTDAGDYDVKATAHITNPRDGEELTATMDEFFEEIALGHDYGEPIFAWQWDEENEEWSCETATLECSRDDTVEKTHSLTANCTVEPVTIPATCTAAGKTVYTASVTFTDGTTTIGPYTDSKTVEIEALGHDYGKPIFAWQWDEENEEWSCETATLECSRDDTAEKTHSLTEECTVTSVTTDPTCTEKGETVYTATVHFALNDNDSYVEPLATPVKYTDTKTVEIDALGHTPSTEVVIEEYIAPTCEMNGSYDSVIYCEVCSEEVSREHKELEAIGHSYGEGVVTKEPTCTEAGELTYTCQNDEEHTYTEEIPANGHKPLEAVVENYVAPTCEMNGSYDSVIYCEVCSEEVSREHKELEAIGHAYGEGVVTKEATCTEAGELTYTCQNDESHTYTESIDPTGHTAVTDPAVEPTCTETGLTEGSHCSVCNETIVAQEVIPANGHTAVTDPAVEPTCTETGLTEGSHCSVCNETIVAQEVIPANGHTPVTDEAVEPTCTETGLTEGSHCSVCNEVLVAQTEIPALGHNLEYTEAKASSATISGNTEYWYCSVCNKYYADEACTTEISLEDTVIPPTGLVLVPVEVTDIETGEIITVYFDGDTGIYYADSEGIIVIHPDSIIPHDSSISVTEEQTTEEVTEQEVTTEGNTGSAENDNGTVNESSVVQLDEEPDEDTEDEEEPDEDEENEDGVKANGSATSPATGMTADILGGSASLAALVAVFAILSRRNKKKAK